LRIHVLDAHPDRRANAGEGIDHQPDQCAVAQADDGRGALSRWVSIGAFWLFWLDGEKRKPLILHMWVEGLSPLLTSNTRQRDNAIGRHPRHPKIGGGTDNVNVRHFIRSRAFRLCFSQVTADDAYGIVRKYVSFSQRGPCGQGTYPLVDANGDRWEFNFESFCNSYDLLTFGMVTRRMRTIVAG